jgi:hypothetical protein
MESKFIAEFSVKVMLSIGLASSFIGFFFFTYGKIIEKEIVINNVKYTIDNLGDFILSISTPEIKTELYKHINEVTLPNMDIADENVRDDNNKLLKKSFKYLGTLLLVSLIVSYIICIKYELDFIEIITQNIVLLCGIGLVEFLFLRLVIANYISANPNIVKRRVLQLLKE